MNPLPPSLLSSSSSSMGRGVMTTSSSNDHPTNNIEESTRYEANSPALSWHDARHRLKRFLSDYAGDTSTSTRVSKRNSDVSMSTSNDTFPIQTTNIHNNNNNNNNIETDNENLNSYPTIVRIWIQWDLDILLGAMGSTIAILIIAATAFVNPPIDSTGDSAGNGDEEEGGEDDFYDESHQEHLQSLQLVASILLVVGSFINLWLIRRRKYSNLQGSDSLKRREVWRFLKKLEKQEEECLDRSSNFAHDPRHPSTHETHHESQCPLELAGSTSLTGVYPVYRRHFHHGGNVQGGSWRRVPALLLVKGDHIALQIGDIAPAACQLISGEMNATNTASTTTATIPSSVQLERGETLTLATFRETSVSMATKWPRGRTTLPKDSDYLSALCNNMQIFRVMETPLEDFLQQPRVESRTPQVWRQLQVIRIFLSAVGLFLFFATLLVVLLRIDLTSASMDSSQMLVLALPVPFLAAAAAFPLVVPACLIFIEALGTARILASYHPVAAWHSDAPGGAKSSANIDLLLFRYVLATVSNRLSLQDIGRKVYRVLNALYKLSGASDKLSAGPNLVRVPPASLNILEKLGMATALTLVDDELVCEPQAVPQQLLIPSGMGMKLLDICPTYEVDSDEESDGETMHTSRRTEPGLQDSDSDSERSFGHYNHMPSRRKRRRLLRKAHKEANEETTSVSSDNIDHEVQFEDPLWWQQLPSLKCIGLACLIVDEKEPSIPVATENSFLRPDASDDFQACKTALSRYICAERRSTQLRSLAQCIGFSTQPNGLGDRGDISPFVEKMRLQVLSSVRVKERLEIDSHERNSEESKWWGLLRPDSTSVIVQDTRTGSYQLMTIGDPRVVTRMCNEAWQGENSTILPLSGHDRSMILETTKGWRLGDLDVEAFSYAPIPSTFENLLMQAEGNSKFYLLENDPRGEPLLPTQSKTPAGEWPLLQNQIFLGVLGSSIIPRQETQGLLSTLQDAGVRFVFMSPRNMRLTKEIAAQMGIDIAWNAAISLRPLEDGEEDEHRMISNYADWDVNAKLPHGIESVKRHLKEVDNVPLLVSLFTDVTKVTTMQMIEIFQDYHDTVIAVGLSHMPRNSSLFSTADLGVGVDVLTELLRRTRTEELAYNSVLPSEILFVSVISAHACAFRLQGVESIAYMPSLLAQGRASLEAAIAASLFLLFGCLSFAFFTFFSVCSVATTMPLPEIMGAFLTLQVILPLMGIPMTMSDPDSQCMQRVPAKNDPGVTFGKKEDTVFFVAAVLKALPPAIFPQLLYLIAFGELMIRSEPDILTSLCPGRFYSGDWPSVIRCDDLREYTGPSRSSAISLALGEFLLCIIVVSAGFVHRALPLHVEPPWRRNALWISSSTIAILIVGLYLGLTLETGSFAALPWYFFIMAGFMPFLCLAWVEYIKRTERSLFDRAEKLRRLQFETRLGMWSPK